MSINSNRPGDGSEIDRLVAEGRYAEAARAARAAGVPARAADLYERIWEFAEAARCAREAGDLGRALRDALDARDEALTASIADELEASGDEGRRIALAAFAARRRHARAGALAEALGERERAIELYRQGGRDLDAARLLDEAGRDRDAATLLERIIDLGVEGPEASEAQLRLGLILARRMRHEPAVRHLQEATRYPTTRRRARRALVVELAALGLRDAARDVLLAAREDEPELSPDLDVFLRDHRGEVGEAPEEREAELIAGRYRLEKPLGAGGAGRVFRARDEVSGRQIALKMFSRTTTRGNDAFERFVREARVAGALRHPNLVEVYEFSAEQGFMVMELMVGGSLAEKLQGGPLPPLLVRRVLLDVLGGLEFAHQRGIIHRDLKPGNIFFDARGTAKIGDFGVAHLLDMGQTQTGGLIGTLAYMSPEQITGAPLSITADFYALGITLFQALTGRLPFLGPDFVAQHLGETPPVPSEVAPVAPPWDPIIARLLQKTPDERFGSIEELRRAVQAIDLGEAAAPRPLVLPRATPGRASSSTSIPVFEEAPEEAAPRYQFETNIGTTAHSRMSRALDSWLERSVIIERFDPGAVDERVARRLYALARGGGPFVQRTLAFDRASGVAVFEAPSGAPIADALANQAPNDREAVRLLKRLARAVAPIHEAGAAHGALGDTTVLVDQNLTPTILASGLGPVPRDPVPADDIEVIVRLLARAVGARPDLEGLIEVLGAPLPDATRADLLRRVPIESGEALYQLADAVEIALLRAQRRAAVPGPAPARES